MSKLSPKKFFQKIEKSMMKSFFPISVAVLVSNFSGVSLEAKIKIETGIGLKEILRSRTSRSQLQPWYTNAHILYMYVQLYTLISVA